LELSLVVTKACACVCSYAAGVGEDGGKGEEDEKAAEGEDGGGLHGVV
jgi:hypothetical protein